MCPLSTGPLLNWCHRSGTRCKMTCRRGYKLTKWGWENYKKKLQPTFDKYSYHEWSSRFIIGALSQAWQTKMQRGQVDWRRGGLSFWKYFWKFKYMNILCSGRLRSSTVSSNCTSSRWSGGSLTTPWNVPQFRYFRLPGDSKEVHSGKPACRDKVLVQLRARIRPVRRQVCQVKIWIMSKISKFEYFIYFYPIFPENFLVVNRCSKTKKWIEGPTKERPACTSNFPPPFIMWCKISYRIFCKQIISHT